MKSIAFGAGNELTRLHSLEKKPFLVNKRKVKMSFKAIYKKLSAVYDWTNHDTIFHFSHHVSFFKTNINNR
jgi:4-diphosphocytidyl-2C-methyl-D-erythritol kinase